ncbi:MAG: hypothetical protein U9N84_06985 [Actinomycetota bacterium]|nr:hypothetical protein [Actinomycetota bacterium]
MTIRARSLRCEWCGGEYISAAGPGRPPRYCRRSHRQRAYEARRLAGERGIGPDEVLVSRRTWERLRDALYRIETASEDVAMDLMTGRPTKAEYVEALAHLSAAVRDLQDVAVEPIAAADA